MPRYCAILRCIIIEAINGSGYNGMIDGDIPVEAKIVAVADVFDALTSVRPYKEAWSNERAFLFLNSMAGTKFDIDCVAALINPGVPRWRPYKKDSRKTISAENSI